MTLPFSVEQFFAVVQHYNLAVWPAQVGLVALALAAIVAVWLQRGWTHRFVSAVLALLWAWTALGFHFAFFTSINPAAYGFGALALAGSAVFLWLGVAQNRLVYAFGRDGRSAVAAVLALFALVVYPVWSSAAGHAYPDLPTFGLPCPTTIFTIGLLALASGRPARIAMTVPVLWSLIGGQAAFLLDVPPDLGLLAAGLVGLALMAWPAAAASHRASPPPRAAH